MQDDIGHEIGRYRLVSFISRDSFSTVYRATDTRSNREVALKTLPPSLSSNPATVQSFLDEARQMAGLQHPNIVAVHDVGLTEEGRPYAVTDLLDGTSLSQLAAQRGPLPFIEASAILGQIASALDYLHGQGVVLGDLQPDTIVVSQGDHATLLDSGISRVLTAQGRPTQAAQSAAPAYVAPEQIGGGAATSASDIYALGAIAYELLAGRPPFRGDMAAVARAQLAGPPTIAGVNMNVPPAAAQAIARAMAANPAQRPPSGAAFMNLLTGGAPTEVISAVVPPLSAAPAIVRRPYTWAMIAAVVLAILIGGLLAYALTRPRAPVPLAQQPAVVASATSAPATPIPTPIAGTAPTAVATAVAPPAVAVPAAPTLPPLPSAVPRATTGTVPTAASPSAQSQIETALRSLPAGSSADFIDPANNTEVSDAGQSQVPGGNALQLILAETAEQELAQGRLSRTQSVTIQPADAAPGSSAGQVQPGQSIQLQSLLQSMLVNNDPTAANALLRTVGGPNAVNQEAGRLGLSQTHVAGSFSASGTASNSGNTTSAHDLALLLTDIVGHRGMPASAADDLLGLLQRREQQAPSAMASGQPPGSVVATIGSTQPDEQIEAGVLQAGNGQRGALGIAVRSPSAQQAAVEASISQVTGRVTQALAL
jgi:eukaryotic-like serine/threonine-protein kinase